MTRRNIDAKTVAGFGREWSTFDQGESSLDAGERERIFRDYFEIFPWHLLPKDGGVGFDAGCGSGRWAMLVAPRVAHLHLIDASAEALAVARSNLAGYPNVSFHHAGVDAIPLSDCSADFAYSLGVLHHIPDTASGIRDIATKLKSGAPFLVYLYYALDNRPAWSRAIWHVSNLARKLISRLPYRPRYVASQAIAALIYWPLARFARALEAAGLPCGSWPLSYYRDKGFYTMRTDAFDRLCTPLEQRFSKPQIEAMLVDAGFGDIRFSDHAPFWCAVGIRS
jgi:SAM-dependent methyltransferase